MKCNITLVGDALISTIAVFSRGESGPEGNRTPILLRRPGLRPINSMDLISASDCKNAAVRSHAHAQESEDIELAVVWFGRFVLGYCIRSIDAQARLDHNHNWRVEDRSPRVPISGSPARRRHSASGSAWRFRQRLAGVPG